MFVPERARIKFTSAMWKWESSILPLLASCCWSGIATIQLVRVRRYMSCMYLVMIRIWISPQKRKATTSINKWRLPLTISLFDILLVFFVLVFVPLFLAFLGRGRYERLTGSWAFFQYLLQGGGQGGSLFVQSVWLNTLDQTEEVFVGNCWRGARRQCTALILNARTLQQNAQNGNGVVCTTGIFWSKL